MIETVSIVGKGALGLLFGDLIARNKGIECIEYVMDDARYERHKGEAVTVNGKPCQIPTVRASEARTPGLIIVATKATELDAAIETIKSFAGPDTHFLSLLNGISSEEKLAREFGWDRLPLCVAQGMDAVFMEGALTYSHAGELRVVAAEDTSSAALASIISFLEESGIPCIFEDDMRRRLWTKYMMNVGVNQTCMAYGGTYGSVSAEGEQNRMFVAAMRDVLAVANAEGVHLTEADLAAMSDLAASLDPNGLPSMAQDRINRKPSEVDEFSGALIALAEKHGILVPANRYLNKRIHEIESEYV